MKTNKENVKAAILNVCPSAKLCRVQDAEIVVSMPENSMTDAEMDQMRDTISAALPEGASLAEEEGALLTVTW
jgi:hypothetical protein